MRVRLTPARRRGVEILDDPATAGDVRARAMADIARSNLLFGGTRSVRRALTRVWATLPRRAVLLDVGTGLADIPEMARHDAQRVGVTLTTWGLDVSGALLLVARQRLAGGVVGDARRLPVSANSVDIVTCSQVLHHFADGELRPVIAELNRVSRGWVVISDLERSWFAAGGFWVASVALRFHPATRHDGVTSVFRGFTSGELETLVREATGIRPLVHHGMFWRLSAIWSKRADDDLHRHVSG